MNDFNVKLELTNSELNDLKSALDAEADLGHNAGAIDKLLHITIEKFAKKEPNDNWTLFLIENEVKLVISSLLQQYTSKTNKIKQIEESLK